MKSVIIIEKYNCGICVNPNDTEDIANAINFLINNPKESEKMGYNGRIAIENHFNWNLEELKLIKLYKENI